MAGQGIERRDAMRVLALAAVAAEFPFFERWAFAQQPASASTGPKAPYVPQFFSEQEYRTLSRLAELIIPSDGTPGAREAGASEFVDFIVFSDPPLQPRFRYGLAWIEAHARFLFGKAFLECSEQQQVEMLEHLAYRERHRQGEEDGRAFFSLLRDYTVMAFYTSRVGMEELNVPGLRIYPESPGCPDPSDSLHRHRHG